MVLEQLVQNRLFWSVLVAVVAAQGLKIALLVLKRRQRFFLADLVVTGGMPSSHSALVSSLALGIYLSEGFSALFFVAIVLALIVLRDSLGVRRTAGEEGQVLNELIKRSKLRLPNVHYSLGHTPAQVIVGVLIGIASACVVFLL
ncbi:divergent PAP2 family protein [Candidatus Woesearchaeota archaeon]|nr:divergent PAP2 family protein [Candidatus Woesearchaeota archaeon]